MINNIIMIKKTINKHITQQFNRHIIMIIYIETIYRYMNVNDDIIFKHRMTKLAQGVKDVWGC